MRPLEAGDVIGLCFPSGNTRPVDVIEARPFGYHGMPGLAQKVVVSVGSGRSIEGIQVGRTRVAFLDPRYSHAPNRR